MTAAYRLKGLGWFGGCTAVVLGFYLVSLQVAAERKKLEHLDGAIAATQRDIRALETEFDTRANLAQLERWNGDTLALSAPQAGQFVRAAALASMEVARQPDRPGVRTAALVVPSLPVVAPPAPAPAAIPAASAPAAPVAVAAARPALVVPGRARPAPVAVAAARPTQRPAAPRVQVAFAKVPPHVSPAMLRVAASLAAGRPSIRPAALLRPRQIAMLDRHLLSDSTLGDLASGARAERGRFR